MKLVLGSGSPRRRELLGQLGVPFTVLASDVHERDPLRGEEPDVYAIALARAKAEAVAAMAPAAIVLAADTVVEVDGEFLAKPRDTEDAMRMLSLLRGRSHTVVTGLVVRCGTPVHEGQVAARVAMREYTDDEMRDYVASGEPMDKAGAYAVQGLGGRLVAGVDGCYLTVVGLPLCLTSEFLRLCGVQGIDAQAARCMHGTFPEAWPRRTRRP